MKKKELTEIKSKTIEDLYKLIVEKEKQLATSLVEQKLAKVKNVHLAGQLRKDLARIKTIARQKLLQNKKTEGSKENGTD